MFLGVVAQVEVSNPTEAGNPCDEIGQLELRIFLEICPSPVCVRGHRRYAVPMLYSGCDLLAIAH